MPGNDHFRQITDSARQFIILSTDTVGRIAYANPAAARVLGWEPDALVGQPIACIFTPEDAAAGVPEQEMATARANGYASDERWHVRRDGARFWAIGEVTPINDDDGQVCGFVKILQDRTGDKAHEQGLTKRTGQLERRLATRTRERDRLWANSLDLLLEMNPEGVLRAINPAWLPTLGYDAADLVGKPFTPFVHPDDLKNAIRALGRASRGPVDRLELRIRHKDGGYRDIAWSAAPGDGMVYANGRDITREKRQAEQLAEQAQARLRLALEAGRMGAWEWNMQTGQVSLLDGAAALHGLADDAPSFSYPTMADYARVIHPDDRPRLKATMDAALEQGGAQRVEYRVLPPGGGVRWLEVRGVVLRDAAGAPCHMPGVSVDITARKQAEQDMAFLEQASVELARLVDLQSTIDKVVRLAVPNFADWCAIDLVQDGQLVRLAVAHVDPDKVALAHELHRRFPPGPDDPGSGWRIVHSGRPAFVPQIDQERMRAAIPEPERRRILLDLGLRSYIGVPLISHGAVIGVGTFVSAESGRTYTPQDLELATEFARRAAIAIDNARLYQAVQQADQDKDVFLATLSHELRNPLAAISNAVALMGLQPPRPIGGIQQIMQRQVGQLSRLVDDLLDISRIATGKIALRRAPVDLAGVLQHAVEACRPLVEARRQQLDVRGSASPITVFGDAARLAQVFANLLGNAAKFTPEGGRIDVEVTLRPGECAVHVRDTGIGIDADMLPRLFQLFAQGRQVDGAAAGLGIGLSLADRLVQLHGGRIAAHSDGAGKGSEFVVRLPVMAEQAGLVEVAAPAAPATASRAAPAAGNWWQGRRILVVDDNVDAATTLGALLQTFGAQVQVVHDGAAALDAVRAHAPAAVLLDIGMPVMDGLEAARRIRADGVATILIALTGWGQVHDRQAAQAAGFDHHWVKPVSLERLRGFAG